MFAVIDAKLERQLTDVEARKRWLVLDKHPDFAGHWEVFGFTDDYLFDFADIFGQYRALAPSGLAHFLGAAEALDYQIAFFDDPAEALRDYEHLNAPPEVSVNSQFANTVNGMLPFQVQGFNMLKDRDYGVARWDTGTGKTVLASALVKYHLQRSGFDICFFVVKKHNKTNTARKLKKFVGIEDVRVIKGTPARRSRQYEAIKLDIEMGRRDLVVVVNYEQFKDFVTTEKKRLVLSEWGEAFFPDCDVMCIWDEMPTKLKNRTTQVYKAICKCLYRTDPPQVMADRLRPKSLRSYMLSATPIENNPEDWFNCTRLLDGGRTYGTVSAFHEIYVESWNFFRRDEPDTFHNSERMRLSAAHFVHQANKKDPDIAAVFPKQVEELVYIDWDDKNAGLYDDIQDLAEDLAEDTEGLPIFALINLFQMLCDAPAMILDSAARREAAQQALEAWEETEIGRMPDLEGSGVAWALSAAERFSGRFTNDGHPKIEKLRELLVERHPTEQAALYTRWNEALMPYLEAFLQEWEVPYVRYSGTERQKQFAQDAFQNGEVRVFLSSDSGSDSIDLDAGNVVIDYDLPWKWTTLTQRHNRVHRASSTYSTVYYYTLLMENSVEDRVLQVITKKQGYHNELFDPAAGDFSASARITKQELMWVLTGR